MCGPNLHYARCLLCIPDILETNCRLSGTRAADASLGTFGRPHRARSICSAKSRKSSHLDASGIQISGRYRGGGEGRKKVGRWKETGGVHDVTSRCDEAKSFRPICHSPSSCSLSISLPFFYFFFFFSFRRSKRHNREINFLASKEADGAR